MQAHWHTEDCLWAQALAEQLLNLFEDKQNGGFFFTTHDHEQLLHRPKPLADESTASGNAIAVRVLLRLGYLLGEKRYLDAAERTLKYARSAIEKFPLAHTSLSMALDDYLQPPEIVIIRGDVEVLADWQQQAFATDRLVFAIPGQAENLPEALAAKKSQAKTVAYICKGFECSPPITELEQLQKSR